MSDLFLGATLLHSQESDETNANPAKTEITLKLSVDQVNQILAALGERPYAEVIEVIAEIQQQARRQLDAPREAEPDIIEAQ